MSDELQALCFMAGANSIFYGEKLLTASNPEPEKDNALFARLGIEKMKLPQNPQTPRTAEFFHSKSGSPIGVQAHEL